jgi:ABC-type multidrug transport system fused ATPase/permease subunit
VRETIRTTWKFLRPRDKAVFSIIVLAQGLGNFLDLLGIGAVSLLVMAVASGEIDVDFAGLYRIQVDEVSGGLVVLLVMLAAGAFLFKALGNLLLSLALVRYLARIEVEAAKQMADYIFSGSLADVRRYSPADVQYTLNASTAAMYGGILNSIASIVTGSGLMIMIIAAFFAVNVVAALAVGFYLLVVVSLIQWMMNEKLKELGRNVNRGSVAANSSLWDLVMTFREISVLGRQEFFVGKYSQAREVLARTRAQETVLKSAPRLIIEQGLLLGVLGFVSWQVLGTDVAEGLASVGVFVVGSLRIVGAVVPVQNSFASLKTTVIKAEMAQSLQREMLSRELRESLSTGEDGNPELQGLLSHQRGLAVVARGVTYTYPEASTPAIRGLDLEAQAGSFIALVGPSGAGKTTVAELILGLARPDKGSVLVGGMEPSVLREALPGLVSYVPQKPGMVSGTILQNVALGIPDEEIDSDWANECLRLASLEEFVQRLPSGINTGLGRQSDKLSGGQLQRLGLARALYSRPRLIVLDEATSSLDAGSEHSISRNIRDLGDSVTLVVIAHRLSTIQHADSVYVVNEGEIIASGPFKTVRKTVPLIEEYVRLMSFDDAEE